MNDTGWITEREREKEVREDHELLGLKEEQRKRWMNTGAEVKLCWSSRISDTHTHKLTVCNAYRLRHITVIMPPSYLTRKGQ